jgi:hypothetical protein
MLMLWATNTTILPLLYDNHTVPEHVNIQAIETHLLLTSAACDGLCSVCMTPAFPSQNKTQPHS